MKIVLPGGSGHIGNILATHFHQRGDQVVVLSRKPAKEAWRVTHWDGNTLGDWARELDGAHVVINLAGRSVNCRYNAANRKEILDSRVNSTRVLGEAIAQCTSPPRLWMNSSTATIYRHSLDRAMDENGELGGQEPHVPDTWHFSIDVAKSWEKAFFSAPTPFTRRVALRSAMVMSPDRDGVFDVLLSLVRRGLGGSAGSGDQFVSWIHETDFVRALDFILDHDTIEGPINIASPNPVPNRDFMRILREAAAVSFGLSSNRLFVELGAFFLRTETELILKSRRVIPGTLSDMGFNFQFPEWPSAARDLVHRCYAYC
jgi:uncharacterized protein (TIGR01777 family)